MPPPLLSFPTVPWVRVTCSQLLGGDRAGGSWHPGHPVSHCGPWLSESSLSTICRHNFGRVLYRPNSSPHLVFSKMCFSPHRHQRDSVYPADRDEAQQMLPEREGSHVTTTLLSSCSCAWPWTSRHPLVETPSLSSGPFSPLLPSPPSYLFLLLPSILSAPSVKRSRDANLESVGLPWQWRYPLL